MSNIQLFQANRIPESDLFVGVELVYPVLCWKEVNCIEGYLQNLNTSSLLKDGAQLSRQPQRLRHRKFIHMSSGDIGFCRNVGSQRLSSCGTFDLGLDLGLDLDVVIPLIAKISYWLPP